MSNLKRDLADCHARQEKLRVDHNAAVKLMAKKYERARDKLYAEEKKILDLMEMGTHKMKKKP